MSSAACTFFWERIIRNARGKCFFYNDTGQRLAAQRTVPARLGWVDVDPQDDRIVSIIPICVFERRRYSRPGFFIPT
jgi:hypothetical protein